MTIHASFLYLDSTLEYNLYLPNQQQRLTKQVYISMDNGNDIVLKLLELSYKTLEKQGSKNKITPKKLVKMYKKMFKEFSRCNEELRAEMIQNVEAIPDNIPDEVKNILAGLSEEEILIELQKQIYPYNIIPNDTDTTE